MNLDRLRHASVCMDIALDEAESGDYEKAREYIRKCKESLEMVE